MTKRDFLKLVEGNKDIYRCLFLDDVTIRSDSPHTALKIGWNGHNNAMTTVKVMRGRTNDLKNINVLDKYKGWLESSNFYCA